MAEALAVRGRRGARSWRRGCARRSPLRDADLDALLGRHRDGLAAERKRARRVARRARRARRPRARHDRRLRGTARERRLGRRRGALRHPRQGDPLRRDLGREAGSVPPQDARRGRRRHEPLLARPAPGRRGGGARALLRRGDAIAASRSTSRSGPRFAPCFPPPPAPPSASVAFSAPRVELSPPAPPERPRSLGEHEDGGDATDAPSGAPSGTDTAGGLQNACATASAGDLMALGDAARSNGQRSRAVQIYEAIRARFGGTDLASIASFHLGQLAFDQGGSLAEARRGFATYLAERPNGPLAQEALGRMLEVERAAGASTTARSLAETYLDRFPRGPHATLARSLLDR